MWLRNVLGPAAGAAAGLLVHASARSSLKDSGRSLQDRFDTATALGAANRTPPAPPAPPPALKAPGAAGGKLFTRAEVAAGGGGGGGGKPVWVTFRGGVYDVSDFVSSHPGGQEKIMLAAGKDLEPFWRLYQQHLKANVMDDVLGKLRIGSLAAGEEAAVVDSSDPYCHGEYRRTERGTSTERGTT